MSFGNVTAFHRFRSVRAAKFIFAAALFVGSWALLAGSAQATVMLQLSLPELVSRSDVIVVGRVLSVRSRIALEQGAARPYTFVEIAVERVVAGEHQGATIVLQETGGAWVGETHAHVSGTPGYRVGEHVLVFAQGAPHLRPGRFRTTAMAQGKFAINSATRPEVVSRDLRGLSFVAPGPLGELSLSEGEFESAVPLADILAAVASRLSQ